MRSRVSMPPVPMPPTLPPCLCLCSRSAAVQSVVAMVVRGVVRFALILSPFPLEDTEGRASLPLPCSPAKGTIHPVRPVDGRRKGLRILCAHVCGAPRVRASAAVPEESESSGLGGVGISGRRPSSPISLLLLALSSCWRPHKLPHLRTSLWRMWGWVCLLPECTRMFNLLLCLWPLDHPGGLAGTQGHTPPLAPTPSLCPTVPRTRTRIWGKARVPMGLHGTMHSEQPPGDPT